MEPMQNPKSQMQNATVGLCATCAYARAVAHPHGGEPYWRCGKHDEDKTFPKYPRLPVVACNGYCADGENR